MQRDYKTQKAILRPAEAENYYQLQQYPPSKELAAYVEHYWIVRWQLPPGVEYPAEVLPNPGVNISFTPDTATITGVVTKKFVYTLKGSGCILGIRFKPSGFRAFFRHPLVAITDKVLPVSDVFDNKTPRLLHATDKELTTFANELLQTKQPQPNRQLLLANEIVAKINNDRGIRRVSDIIRVFAISERTLQHLFRTYIGVGPKWVIARYRLQDAAAAISSGENDWTAIASDLGYADQSHFIRDFKSIIGEAPGEYAKSSRGQKATS